MHDGKGFIYFSDRKVSPNFEIHKLKNLIEDIVHEKIKLCVLGLGYVGLPIAITLSNKFQVVGYDLNKKRIRELKNKKDSTNEINFKTVKLKSKNLLFTYDKKI